MNAREHLDAMSEPQPHDLSVSLADVMALRYLLERLAEREDTPAPAVREPQPVLCNHPRLVPRYPCAACAKRPPYARVEVITPEPAPDATEEPGAVAGAPCPPFCGYCEAGGQPPHNQWEAFRLVSRPAQQPAPTPGEHQGGGVVDEPEVGAVGGDHLARRADGAG